MLEAFSDTVSSTVKGVTGKLSDLTTTDKTSLVAAINQLDARALVLPNLTSLTLYSGARTTIMLQDGRVYKRVSSTLVVDNVAILPVIGNSGQRWIVQTLSGQRVLLDWWLNAGMTHTAGLQAAVNFATIQPDITTNVTQQKCIVEVSPGSYTFADTVTKPPSFVGLNLFAVPGSVTFNFPSFPVEKPLLKVIGGSGDLCRSWIEGIRFEGSAGSVSIEIAGQCEQRWRNCRFGTCLVGVRFHNEQTGMFTEYCSGKDNQYDLACKYPLQYKRTAGNDSFHGCGLETGNKINKQDGAVALIDDGCLPYNSPLNAQVWFKGACTLFENNNTGTLKPTFHGTLTTERFTGGRLTLGTGSGVVYFAGSILAHGDYVTAGRMLHVQALIYRTIGSVVPYGIRRNERFTLVTGFNRLETPANGADFLAVVRLLGPNYYAKSIIQIEHDGSGAPGKATEITRWIERDDNGYGMPAIDCDQSGQLTFTNAAWPASGVTASVTYTQNGENIYGNDPQDAF